MADFKVQTPCTGLLPVTVGGLRLTEVVPRRMTSLAPYRGSAGALSAAMQAAHGVAWPEPGRMTGQAAARALWFGRELALLIGPEPDESLAAHAALTDQSDAWAVVQLDGRQAVEVLARLCPLDLREAVFAPGHTARTDVAHMAGSVSRLGLQTWQIMVFRSMAATLVHEVEIAMRRVAARQTSLL
ncbi:Sarcosine oxidase gamma subunit [Roseovarius mucosus DSM 17069]|uniref:Sarcosine oxidase gamma subunit n=1 Tax=Roseovarius mucosus DSM 17069 TaxID=1288298 RepID=A0A0A0HIZ3_9RHOB|nr:sarcosine oxidase subunit gamma [Roseovarius mucosus]KGM86856.1 Sarcosine oxidase gamma subunit [Roseovarius mucosus DSM 17069]